MLKHGASHSLAIITCTITSGLLIGIAKDYYPSFHRAAVGLCNELTRSIGLIINGDHVATIVLASALALVWGAAFSMLHED